MSCLKWVQRLLLFLYDGRSPTPTFRIIEKSHKKVYSFRNPWHKLYSLFRYRGFMTHKLWETHFYRNNVLVDFEYPKTYAWVSVLRIRENIISMEMGTSETFYNVDCSMFGLFVNFWRFDCSLFGLFGPNNPNSETWCSLHPLCNVHGVSFLKFIEKIFCQNFLKEYGTQNQPTFGLLDHILSKNFGNIFFRIKMATLFLGLATFFLGLATFFLGMATFFLGF